MGDDASFFEDCFSFKKEEPQSVSPDPTTSVLADNPNPKCLWTDRTAFFIFGCAVGIVIYQIFVERNKKTRKG
jgi:hypothetical protein